MIKALGLALSFFLFFSNAYSFVARIIDSNKKSCEEKTDINLAVGCFKDESLGEKNIGTSSALDQLNNDIEKIGDLILPLDFARNRSLEIVEQTNEQIKKNKKFRMDLEAKKNPLESKAFLDHQMHFKVISALEYKLTMLKATLPKCFKRRRDSKASLKRCEEEREDKLAPIKNQINIEYERFPLLQERSVQKFMYKKIDERLNDSKTGNLTRLNNLKTLHSQCKADQRRKKTRSRKKKSPPKISCDDEYLDDIEKAKVKLENDIDFKMSEKDNRELFLNALDASDEVSQSILSRHKKTAEKITKGLNNFEKTGKVFSKQTRGGLKEMTLEDLHEEIFEGTGDETLNRLTEYHLSIDQNLIKRDPTYRFAACKIGKERDANELNEQIQSYALDAATVLIPFGGAYFVSAKALSKLAKSVNSVDKAVKIAKGRKLTLAGVESSVAAVDVTNLNAKAAFCKDIEGKNLTLKNTNEKFEATKKECQAILDDHTLSTSLALLGGGLGTAFSFLGTASKVDKIEGINTKDLIVRKELADKAIEKQTGKASDITLEQAVAVEKAHRASRGEVGADGVNPAGVDNLTGPQKRERVAVLKNAEISIQERRALFKEEVVGDEVAALFDLTEVRRRIPSSHNSDSPLSAQEISVVEDGLFRVFLSKNTIDKTKIKLEQNGRIRIDEATLKELSKSELSELNEFLNRWNRISGTKGYHGLSSSNERVFAILNEFDLKNLDELVAKAEIKQAGPTGSSSVEVKKSLAKNKDTKSAFVASNNSQNIFKSEENLGAFTRFSLKFRAPKSVKEFDFKIADLERKAEGTTNPYKRNDLKQQAKQLREDFRISQNLPSPRDLNIDQNVFLKLKDLGESANNFHPNATRFVNQVERLTPAQRKAVFENKSVTNNILDKVDDSDVVDILAKTNLERSANFSHNFNDLKFDISLEHERIFNNELKDRFFPPEIFPPRSVRLTGGKIRIHPDKITGDHQKAREYLDKFAKEIKSFYYDGGGDELAFYDKIFEAYGINEPKLLLKTKRAVIGDIKIPSRSNSWEESGTREVLEASGIKFDFNPTTGEFFLESDEISEANLSLLHRSKKRLKDISESSSQQALRKQEAFLAELNSPIQVQRRLNPEQKELIPEQLDTTVFQDGNGNPINGFEKVEFKDSNFTGKNSDNPTTRTSFRNTKTGVSFLEVRDTKTKELYSVEVIAARDPRNPEKGVEFLTYENGRLSDKFKLHPSHSSHSNVGFGCMSCHGATTSGGRQISSFAPLGTGTNQGSLVHPSVVDAGLESSTKSGRKN